MSNLLADKSLANDLLYPLVFNKTATSFQVFLERGTPSMSQGSSFSFILVR